MFTGSCRYKGIFEFLNLRLVYHTISLKNLAWRFSKTSVYLINQIEESWRLKKIEGSVRVEFSEFNSHGRVIKIGDFYWLGIVLVVRKEWQHMKKIVIVQDIFNPILPILW